MKIHGKDYRAPEGKRINLKKWPTREKPFYRSEEHYQELLAEHGEKLEKLQDLLYGSASTALLLIFQGMDASGKDGAIKHVMSGVNPQGCQVTSFKAPSAEELAHDFLWRTVCKLPARGQIGIFNRSYYEEVLILKVHPELLKGQGIDPKKAASKGDFWEKRYKSIRELEAHLLRNGTQILKFYLHLSKDEQARRFLDRIDEPNKNWKFGAADFTERSRWSEYMDAYEQCLEGTSTKEAPWHVVPADDKLNARLLISHLVVDALEKLPMSYPASTPEHRRELLRIRKKLVSKGKERESAQKGQRKEGKSP